MNADYASFGLPFSAGTQVAFRLVKHMLVRYATRGRRHIYACFDRLFLIVLNSSATQLCDV
jgi:hypothetical protein